MYYRALMALLVALAIVPRAASAQAETVFRGRPTHKVTSLGSDAGAERVNSSEASNLQVVISRIGNRYYWASRENVELARVDAGAFTTFTAVNGAGYIRFTKQEMRSAVGQMSPTEATFGYVEHILIGLRSITYYGDASAYP